MPSRPGCDRAHSRRFGSLFTLRSDTDERRPMSLYISPTSSRPASMLPGWRKLPWQRCGPAAGRTAPFRSRSWTTPSCSITIASTAAKTRRPMCSVSPSRKGPRPGPNCHRRWPPNWLPIWATCFLAFPYAARQARRFGHSLAAELQLLVVHGTLHLLGFDHDSKESRAAMWREQAHILAGLTREDLTARVSAQD